MATKKTKKPARKSKSVAGAKRTVARPSPRKKTVAAGRAAARKKAVTPKRASPARKPARKPAPKKKAASVGKKASLARKAASVAKAPPIRRREGGGRLPAKYAADLRAKSRNSRPPPEPRSFIDGSRTDDDLAEELGEEFIAGATSGEAEGQDTRNQAVPEERGGPFVLSSGGTEFAGGTDASNPKGAKREPFPTT
jgi:hypothetical protein